MCVWVSDMTAPVICCLSRRPRAGGLRRRGAFHHRYSLRRRKRGLVLGEQQRRGGWQGPWRRWFNRFRSIHPNAYTHHEFDAHDALTACDTPDSLRPPPLACLSLPPFPLPPFPLPFRFGKTAGRGGGQAKRTGEDPEPAQEALHVPQEGWPLLAQPVRGARCGSAASSSFQQEEEQERRRRWWVPVLCSVCSGGCGGDGKK